MKITLRMPELNWRQETVDVPKSRVQVLKDVLRARQGRINQQLIKGNEETARQLDKAARSGGMSSSLKWVGAGVVLGAAAGMLLAPTEGKTAREKVGQSLKTAGKQTAGSAKSLASKAKAVRSGSDTQQDTAEESTGE